jgi:hypothetical protein
MKNDRFGVLAVMLCSGLLAPGRLAAQQPAQEGPDTVRYEAKRGPVTFTHAKHAKMDDCESCHHGSKPEKPAKAAADGKQLIEKCSACHGATVTAPMTTSLKKAYHDTARKTGMCIDCHKKEMEAGKQAPVACNDCHIKA